ncbi:MAG: glycerophosphodiester phosphodiesterase family protein [Candidatus Acidiferrales bacterium]
MRQPWIIAHRGASGYAPENTLAAFRAAVEMGATFIETDLHMTRDAQFVAIHDSNLQRTTNGTGAVRDMTLAQLKDLDAGRWFDHSFIGERVPTLEEILAFGRQHDVVFYLELKYEAAWGMHHALAAALRGSGDVARSIVLSFDPGTLDSLLKHDPTVMTGLLVEEVRPDTVRTAVGVGARQLCPRGDLISEDLVNQAHLADLQIATWTLNQADQIRRVIAAGVDGIMTDFPDRLRTVMQHLEPED